MSARCIFTRSATVDLEAIADYIALDSPSRAKAFVNKIKQRCEKIVMVPQGYPLMQAYGASIRKVPFGNYRIFYTIHNDDVVILRVIHGARGIADIAPEEA